MTGLYDRLVVDCCGLRVEGSSSWESDNGSMKPKILLLTLNQSLCVSDAQHGKNKLLPSINTESLAEPAGIVPF
jgi:hypothetical protein